MIREKIKGLFLRYNQKPDLSRLSSFSEDYKRKVVQEERSKVKSEVLFGLQLAEDQLTAERQRLVTKADKIRFPLSNSAIDRTAGELQRNSAALYLMRDHPPDAVVNTLQTALETKRLDYFFALVDGLLSGFQRGIDGELQRPQDRVIAAGIDRLLASFPDKAELDEVEKRLADLPVVESMLSSFKSQVEAGVQTVLLPDLLVDLDEGQRLQVLSAVEQAGNIQERIAIKLKLASLPTAA